MDNDNLYGLNEEQFDELNQILLNTQEQCQMVQNLIRNQIQVKDDMINKLHTELESYRQAQADKYVLQVMKGIITIRKNLIKKVNSLEWCEKTEEDLRKELVYVMEDLSDLLEQQNIDAYKSEAGEQFDATKHQVFRMEKTNVVDCDKTIKQSITEGYMKENKVIIPEKVVVYQFMEEE